PDDGERLLEAVDAVVIREAECTELGLVPAGTESEHEAAAAHLVDQRGLLGEQRRVMEVRARDEWPKLDPRRRGRDGRQQRPRLPWPACRPILPAIEQVHAAPERIEPEGLHCADPDTQ